MFLKHNWRGLLWGLLILFLCGLPGDQVPEPTFFEFFAIDKLAHAGMFAILAILFSVGFKKQFSFKLLRYHTKKSTFLVCALYGSLIEVLQILIFVDRHFEALDLVANVIGALLGVIAFRTIYGKELA